MGGSHALFWSSHPVLEFPPPLEISSLQADPFSKFLQRPDVRKTFTFSLYIFFLNIYLKQDGFSYEL